MPLPRMRSNPVSQDARRLVTLKSAQYFTGLEKDQSRRSSHVIQSWNVLINIHIEGADLDPTLVISSYFVNRGVKELARSAIGRKEVDQKRQG